MIAKDVSTPGHFAPTSSADRMTTGVNRCGHHVSRVFPVRAGARKQVRINGAWAHASLTAKPDARLFTAADVHNETVAEVNAGFHHPMIAGLVPHHGKGILLATR